MSVRSAQATRSIGSSASARVAIPVREAMERPARRTLDRHASSEHSVTMSTVGSAGAQRNPPTYVATCVLPARLIRIVGPSCSRRHQAARPTAAPPMAPTTGGGAGRGCSRRRGSRAGWGTATTVRRRRWRRIRARAERSPARSSAFVRVCATRFGCRWRALRARAHVPRRRASRPVLPPRRRRAAPSGAREGRR